MRQSTTIGQWASPKMEHPLAHTAREQPSMYHAVFDAMRLCLRKASIRALKAIDGPDRCCCRVNGGKWQHTRTNNEEKDVACCKGRLFYFIYFSGRNRTSARYIYRRIATHTKGSLFKRRSIAPTRQRMDVP